MNANITQIISMFIYIFSAFFMNYSISSLIFSISLLGFVNNSIDSIINIIVNKKLNKISEEILQTLSKNNNLLFSNTNLILESVKELRYKDKNFNYKNNLFLKTNSNYAFKFILENFYINNNKLIDYKNIYDKFFYYSFNNVENRFNKIDEIIENVNIEFRNEFINYFKNLNKFDFSELNILQKILIILFTCSNFKEKIIVFDFCININFDQYEYEIFFKLIKYINSRNFIFFLNEPIINGYTDNFLLNES